MYDVAADPAETHDLRRRPASPASSGDAARLSDPVANAGGEAAALGDAEERKKLASLGYVTRTSSRSCAKTHHVRPTWRRSFRSSTRRRRYSSASEYAKSIPLLEEILAKDPHNLDAALRLATAESALGHDERAVAAFERAEAIAPDSPDVRTYLALHYARTSEWKRAEPMLEQVLAQMPDKVPAIEALESIREREGRNPDAVVLLQKLYTLRAPSGAELAHLGTLAMQAGQTNAALDAFEKARARGGAAFQNDLELGVLYLAAHRFPEARDVLDRIPPSHPDYPMVLFKRAQVACCCTSRTRLARIEAAKQHANAMTRELIARERLFQWPQEGAGWKARPTRRKAILRTGSEP